MTDRRIARRHALKFAAGASAGAAAAFAAQQAPAMPADAAQKPEHPPARRGGRPFVEARDGIQLFYQDWGKGRPIVFVHSWGLNSDMWQYNIADFNDAGFRCIAFDRRGHGRSDRPHDGYVFERLVDDLAIVIETLDLREVTLIGHSLGGAEAVGYLARHGAGRVSRLVLLAAATPFLLRTPDNPGGLDPAIGQAIRASWRRDFPRWLSEGAQAFYRPDELGVSDGIVDWTIDMLRAVPVQVVVAAGSVMIGTDLRQAMGALEVPTLIIHGDADASIPVQFGRQSAKLIPRCRYVEYPGAPHGLFFTHREKIRADVLGWIGAR